MSKIDVVRAAMVEAMKAKDKARKDSLSMLLSALKNAQIDKRADLTEDEENAVVKKEPPDPGDLRHGSGRTHRYPRGSRCETCCIQRVRSGRYERRADH